MNGSAITALALWGMIAGGTATNDTPVPVPTSSKMRIDAELKWRKIYTKTMVLDSLQQVVVAQDSMQ